MLRIIIIILACIISGCTNQATKNSEQNNKKTIEQAIHSVIKNDALIGLWHDAPLLGAGWGDVYQFFPSGKYNYEISEGISMERMRGHGGYWSLEGNRIKITIIKRYVIVGGKTINDPMLIGGKSISGGHLEVQSIPPEDHIISIKECVQTKREKEENSKSYPCLSIDGKHFFYFSKDPTYYTSDDLMQEP